MPEDIGGNTIKRDSLGRILPGQRSLNPAGKPKRPEQIVQLLNKRFTAANVVEMFETAFEVSLENKNMGWYLSTLRLLLEYQVGKPATKMIVANMELDQRLAGWLMGSKPTEDGDDEGYDVEA